MDNREPTLTDCKSTSSTTDIGEPPTRLRKPWKTEEYRGRLYIDMSRVTDVDREERRQQTRCALVSLALCSLKCFVD